MTLNYLKNKELVIQEVNKITLGQAASYGYIGKQIGISGWGVGRILSQLSTQEAEDVPWYRIVTVDGYISAMKLGYKGQLQKQILIDQGYIITQDSVSMDCMIG
jgi:alkylated DNA nucleotide flippase Atl1